MVRVPSTILIAFLVLSTSTAKGQTSSWKDLLAPAPLSPQHQTLGGNCDACHMAFKGIPNQKCLSCHQEIKKRIDTKSGFHGSLNNPPCGTCHLDHQGKQGKHTKPEASKAFDHALTGSPLTGKHQSLECQECHTKPLKDMSAACSSCHQDSHQGSLGNACASCHQTSSWQKQNKTKEAHDISMSDGHTGLSCEGCHKGGRQLQPPFGCQHCHEQTHGDTHVDCDVCHSVAGFKPAKFVHRGCTCLLPGKHQSFNCLSCHEKFQFTNTPRNCAGCHRQDLKHDFVGECSQCHNALKWQSKTFNHQRKTSFPLKDKHLEVPCSGCHKKKTKKGRVFGRTPKKCISCHRDQGTKAHGNFGNCGSCHTTKGFLPTSFDHKARSGFALQGKHASIPCQTCHNSQTKEIGVLRSKKR